MISILDVCTPWLLLEFGLEEELAEDDLKQLCQSLKMLDSSAKMLSEELLLAFFSKGCLCLTIIEM